MKTLAKALKEKNKLKNEIALIEKKLNAHNSVIKGNKRPFNMEEVDAQLLEKVNALVALKAAISKANAPVQEKIFRLAEVRGLISFYRKMTVKEGRQIEGYRDEALDYECLFSEADIEVKVSKLEAEAESLQDTLDSFNFTTTI